MTPYMHLISGRGNWTTVGCDVKSVNNDTGEVTCNCSHLTNFAILVVCLITTVPLYIIVGNFHQEFIEFYQLVSVVKSNFFSVDESCFC